MVLFSVGYKGEPLSGLDLSASFDAGKGKLNHERGKVAGGGGNLFCAGWIKRGGEGVIATNIPDARETVSSIIQTITESGAPPKSRASVDLKVALSTSEYLNEGK